MKEKKHNIKYAAVLGIAIFPVVLLLITIYIWISAKSITAISKDNLSARTNLCATKIDDWAGKIISELNIYRDIVEGYINEPEQLSAFLNSTYQLHSAYPQGIHLGDASGMYMDASGWVPNDDWVLTERPWYVAGKDSDSFVFCEPFVDARLGSTCTSVSARVPDSDAVCVMAVDVYMDYADFLIRDVMSAGNLDGAMLISGPNHIILADSATPPGVAELDDSDDLFYLKLSDLLNEEQMGISKLDTSGEDCYVNIIHLSAVDWYLIGYVHESTFLTPLRKSGLFMSLVGITAVLVLILLTWHISTFYVVRLNTAEARAQENLDMVNDIIGSGMWYMEFNEHGEMNVICWGQRVREMLGFTDKNDFPDKLEAWSDRLHPDDKEQTLEAYWGCIEGKADYDVKYRLKKKNGEYEWYHARGQIARYKNGAPRLYLGTFINITKDLMAQQALEEAYQAANRANAAKTEFMSNMSHDIRTPLNAIIGMTTIAAMHLNEPERLTRCLTEITTSSRHLLGLVNEVLDMNKIESGTVSLNIEPIHLPDILDSVLSISAPLIEAKHQQLSVNVHDVWHEDVYGDADRLQQCLMNFLSNAIKYTPDGGSIKVSISEKTTNRPRRGCYEFIFEDTGIGMSEEFLSRIFEPFSRSDDERVAKQQGTGLGMSITRNIIQMMNGDIKVESKLNEGSRFIVTVFLELQDLSDEQLDEELMDLPVLVADDEQTACESACQILDEMGMVSEWVLTGEEAVEKVVCRHDKGEDFFAVILDWKMPGMDGIATTKAIRAVVGDEVPIIIISAYDWSVIEAEARNAGANTFISKPLFKSRMVYVFRKLIGQEKEARGKDALEDISKVNLLGKKILLVEDNALNAEIAEEILSITGLKIDHASDGKEAVSIMESAADGYYDLIFMDIQMPVMNGYEATRVIRASDRDYLKNIPIIAMSANAFAEDVQQAKASGMDDHIAKPLDLDRLMTVLRRWLLA